MPPFKKPGRALSAKQETSGITATPASHEQRLLTIAAALMIAATVAVYWPALGAGFLGDDFMILHRLRPIEHATDVSRFFRGEFFEYYRPLGFVSHAIDWAIAGQDPREFHLTNLAIHVINTILVLLIGLKLSPRPLGGLLAAALFALHASNNEAVVWMSARFDLLATCFGLAALVCVMRGGIAGQISAPVLFFCALLSKESVVALPIAVAGWGTFRLRAPTSRTVMSVVPWLVALAAYSALRQLGGGISAVGGASRAPKLAAFIICLASVVALSSNRWLYVRKWLKGKRTQCAVLMFAAIAALVVIAVLSHGRVGALAREKLAVAGFATFYLSSPLLAPGESILSDSTALPVWIFGAITLVGVAALILLLWRLLDDDRYWFFDTLLIATLLPISALTEGKRYLYLPSVAMSLIVATFIVELHGRARRVALSVAAVVLAVSAVQIIARVQDWRWAGRMTAAGAQLVDSTLAPACGTGHVVFLTSPVGMRGVYSHFYYETFEVPRGCMPELFQIVVRVVRVDTPIRVSWDGPNQIVITAPNYQDNFVLSHDLREFDIPLRRGKPVSIDTPLGRVTADAVGGGARVVLRLASAAQRERDLFFFYADGKIQSLGQPQ
ncbi:MAG TPA: hypothetical protein VFT39_15105 [Vicinamibacterales bacterium]|nr:hypothetical protein [Vicinamibacterales bacterium]